MPVSLHRLVDQAARGTRRNQARWARLLAMLDLDARVAPEAIHRVIDEELADQRERALSELDELESAHPLRPFLTADSLDRDAFADALRGTGPDIQAWGERVVGRLEAFEERLSWLLRPTPLEELPSLDPVRDRNRIYHAISWHHRLEQKLFALLFEIRGGVAAFAALQFHSSGEFSYRGFRRNNETFLIFANLIEWGLDSKRGREMIAKVNRIHGRYAAANAGFLYTLGGIMFVPIEWNRRVGWRPFTEVEKLGWFHTFVELGRAMGIQGITDDYDEMYDTWKAISEAHCGTSHVGQKLFSEVVVQVLATYPPEARRPLLWALLSGMDDIFREMIGLPAPPPEVVREVREGLRVVGGLGALTEPVPWIRSLQVHPLYAQVDELGMNHRAKYMPRRATRTPDEGRLDANGGYPTGLPPIERLDEIPEPELRLIDAAELARHASDDDAWIAIDGYVYDVTRFLFEHPGGHKVLGPVLGKDATDTFRRVPHTAGAHVLMHNFRVARLADPPEPTVPAPPLRESFPRRVGQGRTYTAGDFHGFVEQMLTWIADYEKALTQPGRDPDVFPIVLPWDYRLQKERGVSLPDPLSRLGRRAAKERV